MSRSVTTPTTVSPTSTTGISPQSFWAIIFATSSSVVFGVQHAGSGVITSRAIFDIELLLLSPFSVLRIDEARQSPRYRSARAASLDRRRDSDVWRSRL